MSNICVGKAIPAFECQATGNQSISSKSLKGSPYIIYFYPKDNTPGCTREGIDFSEHYETFKKLGVAIFGVSRDSLKSHENFKAKFNYPFELISDPDESLCALFDVIKMKNMYGKQVRGIERSTFLVNDQGRLLKEWRKVKVEGHVSEVLEAIKSL